jgi:hypothetical protein
VLVWDNVRLHLTAPDINSQECTWSLIKLESGNLAAADLAQITRAVKRRLKQIQQRPDPVDACRTATGLIDG